MSTPVDHLTAWESAPWPDSLAGIPILYEDEGQEEMGEANIHVTADEILHVCLNIHIKEHRPDCQVFSNMNLYYLDGPPHPQTGSAPYVSPDTMVVKPYQLLPEETPSYKIGRDGPAPLTTVEVLSKRSGQQRDLKEKVVVYRILKVGEYIIVDPGKYLRERLLLKRLGPDGEYHDERDADAGVTSNLGFRLVFEPDGLRVINALTEYRYPRPMEAEQEARAKRFAEERQRAAEERQRAAEERQRAAEERQQAAEARQRAAEKAQRAAEHAHAAEAQARSQAETQRQAAEGRLRALEGELARLKSKDQA
jgi:Uma2 family endonuclease